MSADRADRVLVALGHFESRASAQAAIASGKVRVNGQVLAKASAKISADDRIEAERDHPYVSRGALKLVHALDVFAISVEGRHCLDIGASTGGFTQVLLERGARSVVAVDVGRGQLHPKIAGDARVRSLEATDARNLTADLLGGAPSVIVCDASFIALEKLLAVPLSLAGEGADLVALFKPQFQVGRAHVGKGGIVRSAPAAQAAETRFIDWLAGLGWTVCDRADSPITGGDGNAERLVWAAKAAG